MESWFFAQTGLVFGPKEAKYLDVGSEHGMPQHLDREGCLFIIACGIFPRKLADRLKCAKRQWSQRSLVMKLNNTIASNWKGCAMTLYPKTLPKTEVTTGTTLSSDSSHECIVLHQSLPMY